jgi:hypothetical protein
MHGDMTPLMFSHLLANMNVGETGDDGDEILVVDIPVVACFELGGEV